MIALTILTFLASFGIPTLTTALVAKHWHRWGNWEAYSYHPEQIECRDCTKCGATQYRRLPG